MRVVTWELESVALDPPSSATAHNPTSLGTLRTGARLSASSNTILMLLVFLLIMTFVRDCLSVRLSAGPRDVIGLRRRGLRSNSTTLPKHP